MQEEEYEPPLRKSLFDNVPPFLNYLPNGLHGRYIHLTFLLPYNHKDGSIYVSKYYNGVHALSEAAPCGQHTDNMVELRYSLWRVPMALHNMVTAVEEEKANKVKQGRLGTLVPSDMCDSYDTATK